MPYKFAYFFGVLLMLPIWIILFINRRDLRKEIILTGIFCGILAFATSPLFLSDYWRPEYVFPLIYKGRAVSGLSDFLYGFLSAGIASSIYEEVFRKKLVRRKKKDYNWSFLFITFFAISLIILFALNLLLGLNSIYAVFIAILFPVGISIYIRKDLFVDALLSGILFGAITLFVLLILLIIFPEMVHRWWYLENISGILILGIPVEELLWAFIYGAAAGPLYEFVAGRKLINIKS